MTAIGKRLEAAYPVFDKNWNVKLEPLRDSMVRTVKTSMWVLLGAVGLLLAVACANVANLLLARHNSRAAGNGGAVRGGRGTLARGAPTLDGERRAGAVGRTSGDCAGARRGARPGGPGSSRTGAHARRSPSTCGYSASLWRSSLLTGIVFGLAPSLAASRADLLGGLREDSRGSIGGNSGLRRGLVAAEVALERGAARRRGPAVSQPDRFAGRGSRARRLGRADIPGELSPARAIPTRRSACSFTRPRSRRCGRCPACARPARSITCPSAAWLPARTSSIAGRPPAAARRGTNVYDSRRHARLLPGHGNSDSQRARFLGRRQHSRVPLPLHHQRDFRAHVPAGQAAARQTDQRQYGETSTPSVKSSAWWAT